MSQGAGRGWSARARIVGWLVFLVAVVLAASLLVGSRLVQWRADERLTDELVHEHDKLASFVARSAGAYDRVDELLTAYLGDAFPEETETYFTIVDGAPDRRSGNAPPHRLDLNAAFVEEVASVSTAPRFGSWTIDGTDVRYGAFPVTVPGDERTGSLVVIEFVDRDLTRSTVLLLALVNLGALVVAGAVSWFVAGRLLRPIQAVSDTAERISESDLGQRIEVEGRDDVADLTRTFNRMLDRIETAFDGQRQFLDDAGHELRTPLTVVRGQLELMGDDPESRARVLPLIVGELDRMGRLVDDLLLLARAERPDFLATGPVDVADLTVEVLAKSRTLGERRWTLSSVATETATLDGQRITQALMQLVANAVDHTEPGDQIDVGSAVRDGGLRFWVRDTGAGIAAADQERIFDRFFTARDDESSGLGLAIVRSIAEAHGGRVDLESEVGAGSTFTLVLPASCLLPRDEDDEDVDDDLDVIDATDEAPGASPVPQTVPSADEPMVGAPGTPAGGEESSWPTS